jgi:hypothetical protein
MISIQDLLWSWIWIYSSSEESSGSGRIIHCKQALLYIKYCLLIGVIFKTVQCIQILIPELEKQQVVFENGAIGSP